MTLQKIGYGSIMLLGALLWLPWDRSAALALETDETETILQNSPLVRVGEAETIDYSTGKGIATKTGAFGYSFPLSVPPGRLGVQPNLSLEYNSQSGRGLLGAGWDLHGLPALLRINHTQGVLYQPTDAIAMTRAWGSPPDRDARLVVSTAPPNPTFVLLADSELKLSPVPSGNTCGPSAQPCYWVAHDKSGNTFYFGGDASSHAGLSGTPSTFHATVWSPTIPATAIHAWLLYRYEDFRGNSYVVTWEGSHFDRRPNRIEYTLPAATEIHELIFAYQSRSDRQPYPRRATKYLSEIEVRGPLGTAPTVGTVRRYRMAYEYSPASTSSRLISVTTVGADGTQLVERFKYQNGGTATGQTAPQDFQWPPVQYLGGTPTRYSYDQLHLIGDFNGDGRKDVLLHRRDPGLLINDEITVLYGTDTGFTAPYVFSYESPWNDSVRNRWQFAGDLDGDGIDDFIHVANWSINDGLPSQEVVVTVRVLFGHRSNSFVDRLVLDQAQFPADRLHQVVPGDYDGDEILDLAFVGWQKVTGISGDPNIRDQSPFYWQTAADLHLTGETRTFADFYAANLNGDEAQDLVSVDFYESVSGTTCNDKLRLRIRWFAGGPLFGSQSNFLIESRDEYIDEDGLALITAPAPLFDWRPHAMPGDFNGDGRQETLWAYVGSNQHPHLGSCGGDYGSEAHTFDFNAVRRRADRNLDDFPRMRTLVADINGDGLGDIVQIGSGLVRYAIANPAVSSGFDAFTQIKVSTDQNEFGWWQTRVGDFNGDGRDDLLMAGRSGTIFYYLLGTRSGLSAPKQKWFGNIVVDQPADQQPGAIPLVGDFTGDGKDDVAILTTTMEIWLVLANPNVPDLLIEATNATGGRLEVAYEAPSQHFRAIDNTASCWIQGSNAVSVDCGIPERSARPLVRSIRETDGHAANPDSTRTYEFYNGRRLRGSIDARRSLGFEEVRERFDETQLYRVTKYVQAGEYAGRVHDESLWSDPTRFELYEQRVFSYNLFPLWPEGWNIRPTEIDDVRYEDNTPVLFTSTTFEYDTHFNIQKQTTTRGYDGTSLVSTTNSYFDPIVPASGKRLLTRLRNRYTQTAAGRILGMEQQAYDAARPDEVVRSKRFLFDDIDLSNCPVPANATWPVESANCGAFGHWVTIAQNHQYDSFGNLTYVEDAHGKAHSIIYDKWTTTLPWISTDATGQITSRLYDGYGNSFADWTPYHSERVRDGVGRLTELRLPDVHRVVGAGEVITTIPT